MFEFGRQYIETNRPAIDNVLEAFGNGSVRERELEATIAYLYRHSPHDMFEDVEGFVKHVRTLKPGFSKQEVSDAIDEVKAFLAEGEIAALRIGTSWMKASRNFPRMWQCRLDRCSRDAGRSTTWQGQDADRHVPQPGPDQRRHASVPCAGVAQFG